MATLASWNVTLTNFTCNSTLLELTREFLEQEQVKIPPIVEININGTAFDFILEAQTDNNTTVLDASKLARLQAKQTLRFDPPLTLVDGLYPISVSFRSNNASIISNSSNLEPINLTGCIASGSEKNISENNASTTVSGISSQTETISNPTLTQSELVTATWEIDTLTMQTESSFPPFPTSLLGQSVSNDSNSDNAQSQGQSQNSYVKNVKSAVPAAVLACLLGLVIFFIIRRCRKVKIKRERSSFYAYNDDFDDSEEGRY